MNEVITIGVDLVKNVFQVHGGAIKGPLRGDFYWGSGEAALAQAGRMKQKVRLYLLLPKAVAERRETTS